MGEEKGPEFYTGKSYLNPKTIQRYTPIYKQAIDWILKYGKGKKIVDLGCGAGVFAEMVKNTGLTDYIGFDFSPDMIKLSEERVPEFEFLLSDLTTPLFLEPYTFVALEVLEHIKDDLAVIKNISSSSLIIISLPTFDAKGHVRRFKNKETAEKRYSKFIEFKKYEFISKKWHMYMGDKK